MTVKQEALAEYRARERQLDARPIKKVAEAKARKRKRMTGKLEKARRTAQTLADNPDLSAATKAKEMNKYFCSTFHIYCIYSFSRVVSVEYLTWL